MSEPRGMEKWRPRTRASALALVLLMATLSGEPSFGALSLTKLRQELARSASDIGRVQAKLRPLKKKQINAQKNLAVAKNRLATTQRTLRDVQSQLEETRFRLHITRAELERTRARLKERNDLLSKRLVDNYRHGSISYLSVLLGATDFADLVNRGYIVRKVMQRDVDLLKDIKDDEQRIRTYTSMLEYQENRRVALQQKHRVLTHRAYAQAMDCRQTLSQIQRERAELERILAAENATSARLSTMLRKLQRSPGKGARATTVWHGGLIRPVSGRITSPFGMRFHPILHAYRMHTGTDIAVPSGTPIHAAAGGVVILAGWYGAYGNTVVIDHGGGLATIYGHCSSLSVHYAAKVKQGQVIARVGSTGLSTGPHVHFEVQKNGVPRAP